MLPRECVFTMSDLTAISGYSRGKLDDMRRKGILVPVIHDWPEYSYFDLLKLVLYIELKPHRKLAVLNAILATISNYAEEAGQSKANKATLKEMMLTTKYLLIGEVGDFNYILLRELETDLVLASQAKEILTFIGEIKQKIPGASNIFPGQKIAVKKGIVVNMKLLREKADKAGYELLDNFEAKKHKTIELLIA